MRIFKDFTEARSEIARDLKEMGVSIENTSMQDKKGIFPTLELQYYAYTVLHPEVLDLDVTTDWCGAEWLDRLRGIVGNPSSLGTAWQTRSDEHMIWSDFLEIDGRPIQSNESYDSIMEFRPELQSDPMRLAYTYSERFAINDQVWRIIRELRKNPESRQLYVAMWDPHQDSGRLGYQRVPCSLGWHFMLRDGRLNIRYKMRSCDFVTHWQNDVWLALKLLDYVCSKTGNHPGHFIQEIDSFHVYKKDVKDVF
jgi:Thymidylate synthase